MPVIETRPTKLPEFINLDTSRCYLFASAKGGSGILFGGEHVAKMPMKPKSMPKEMPKGGMHKMGGGMMMKDFEMNQMMGKGKPVKKDKK